MKRLFLSPSVEVALVSAGPSILVGQQCSLSSSSSSSSAASADSYTAYVVAECVPCEDTSVVAEQVECLERVLPFGIDVLGVAGTASEAAEMAALLQGNGANVDLVRVVRSPSTNVLPSCSALHVPSSKVEVVRSAVTFVELRVALHSCEDNLPLLVCSACGADATIVDGESGSALADEAPSVLSGGQLVQLGAAHSTLRLHVVIDPLRVSAQGLYDVLRRQISAAVAAGTTRLVEVQSHNAHVSYCCRVEDAAAGAESEVTAEVLAEVFEMIEDATGVAAHRSDVRGGGSVAAVQGAVKRTDEKMKGLAEGASATPSDSSGSKAKTKPGNDTLLLLAGLAILIVGVLVVTLQ